MFDAPWKRVRAGMLRWLRAAPVENELDRRHAPAIQLVCLVGVGVISVNSVVRLFTGHPTTFHFALAQAIELLIFISAGGCLVAIRRGAFRVGLWLLVAGTALPFSVALFLYGFDSNVHVIRWLPVVMALPALTLGRRALWQVFAVLAVALVLGRARDLGLVSQPSAGAVWVPAIGNGPQAILALLVVGLVLDRFGVALRDLLATTLEQKRELERAAAELRAEAALHQQTQKALVEAQKLEAIGRLSGGVAHDFNNLLTVIISFTDFVRQRLPEAHSLQGDLDQITQAADRASELTRQLLAFARRQLVSPRVVQVDLAVGSLVTMLRRLVGEDITIQTDLRASEAQVLIDPVQLEQVLLNLAANARDAMPRGGTLSLSTRVVEGQLQLTVRDTGSGIPLETQPLIFEPFFTTKEVGRGTGLGLASSWGIIKQSGGTIEVASAPGAGATFTIVLPLTDAIEQVAEARWPVGDARGSQTILVVEDQTEVRRLVTRVLSELGYRVLEASDAIEALSVGRERSGELHLLLTDVVMPRGSNGRELAETLKRDSPHLKVLFMSGYSDEVVARQGTPGTTLDLLPKPFTPQVLASRVRQALQRLS